MNALQIPPSPNPVVWITTPYLTKSEFEMEDLFNSPEDFQFQRDIAGYNSENFHSTKEIHTPRKRITIVKNKEEANQVYRTANPALGEFSSFTVKQVLQCIDRKPIICIASSARDAESSVYCENDTGIIHARYSMFYGGPSGYSGRTAAQGGYALDIPKLVKTVKDLFLNDDLTDALESRDLGTIYEALGRFNFKRDLPIIATEFLPCTLLIPWT